MRLQRKDRLRKRVAFESESNYIQYDFREHGECSYDSTTLSEARDKSDQTNEEVRRGEHLEVDYYKAGIQ
ncbi:hypothetical protein Tco_1067789 [Tanacetum coccineum]|uniref:Uncharacterized protein n=1 Tax=Tanacetum coccineum TaxID=301880 RepID=A0ABQ5HDW3_9ASTR